MLLVELSMSPMGKGESVSAYVARCVDLIDRSGLAYRLGPMGTCIEGDYDEVMALVRHCLDALAADCDRVTFSIKADWRRGGESRLDAKVASVEKKIGRRLKT
jgi:uncharacterized protein (TIGR00106 family)